MGFSYRDYFVKTSNQAVSALYRRTPNQVRCIGIYPSIREAVSEMVQAVLLEKASTPKQAKRILSEVRKSLVTSLA